MNIGLEFLENSGGEAEGLSDAGIEMFRENPFAAVARETSQNSRDAIDNIDEPVLIKFDLISLVTAEFPSIESYRTTARICLAKSKSASREKEIGFFRQAVSVLNADKMKVLRIADYNTKGVRGPCEEGRPFHTLAKTDGMSVKEDIGSGGSFGIGKNAAFALSDIQTVFFSTLYSKENNFNDQFYCMGKTQFISHSDSEGIQRRRKGYWGRIDGYRPLENPKLIPDWLRRSEQGTSIYSICLRDAQTDWRYEMAATILINFFCAIERGEMEFEIDNSSIPINRNTIQTLFNHPKVESTVNQLKLQSAFDAAKRMYECLVDKDTSEDFFEIEDLGRVRVHTLVREGLSYTVGIIRNGMYITDNLSYFDEPFKRFPLHKEFAVIVEPESASESEWFKRLENPRHDSLSAERITDPKMRDRGKRVFGQLARDIRTHIRAVARTLPVKSMDLDELNEFFVMEGSKTEDQTGIETDPRAKITTELKPSSPRTPPPRYHDRGTKDDPPVPGPRDHIEPGPKPGPTPRPRRERVPVELIEERILIPDNSNLCRRRLFFTSPVSSGITISTNASGLNTSEQLKITYSSKGNVSNDAVNIFCDAGTRYSIDVEFGNIYRGPIEISAFLSDESEVESS